jgi:hypothetical protein
MSVFLITETLEEGGQFVMQLQQELESAKAALDRHLNTLQNHK